ncbi:hypothetical protein J7E88_18390 [Streptomyces sp. ISL-10]|uniref:DUF6049 family protein n=1 Tax=Streptomyces sp. ISL-10 TaxID=2819172 RepID=UPI001BE8CDD7|nr:DUF6049 family protein [Streptomyces sp. ISL-10]MBT2367225.1 hypothetical protein [Streptomyces sp. ISL-10]
MAEAADFQGMRTSPARRWLRRSASLLTGVPLVAGLLGGPAAPAAHAAEDATGSRTVDVSLDTFTPSAPGKKDTIVISGTVINEGKQTITDAHVDLRVGQKLSGRTSIDRAAERTGYYPGLDGPEIDDKYAVEIPRLASGISHDFRLSVPADELDLDEDGGVYQLGVSLSGQTASLPFDQVLGIERTFLPWQPEAAEKKTRLTYLWPLISSTHLTSETGSDEQQTPVFEDESLAAELSTGGRLDQLVSLGRELPVTWVIDPDLLATVDAMTRDYQVKKGNTTVPGKNQAVAKRWLSDLEAAVKDRKVVALPFADPDLASLAHRGKSVSGSLSHLKPATEVAAITVETVLHVKASTDFAWPVEGAIDSSIVDVATSAGAHKVIARSDSLQDSLGYTPTAARPIGGGTTAVVTDSRLSKAFQGDMTRSDTSTLAVQEFLAQSLAVLHQAPAKQRSIVVAPQRVPTAVQAQSMARALQALGTQRWTQPLDLVAAADAKPDADANTKVPSTSQYPGKLRKQELPVEAFQDVRGTQEGLDMFEGILTQADRVNTPFGRAIDRELSASWRGNPAAAQQYRNGVRSYLRDLTEEVQLIEKSDVTLSGRSATIPVTVQNELVQGIDHLVLRLTSHNPTRLNLDGDKGIAEQRVQIDGGHSQTVKFPATANVNGQVQMTAQLYTQDGKLYGQAMDFTVKVSEITPTVMLVIAGGVLLLVLAGIRMYTQRKRAGADETAAAEAEEASNDDDTARDGAEGTRRDIDGPDRGQASDLGPETRPESGDPSGAGEKVDR